MTFQHNVKFIIYIHIHTKKPRITNTIFFNAEIHTKYTITVNIEIIIIYCMYVCIVRSS